MAKSRVSTRLQQTRKQPALRDVPDIRDRLYEPTLSPLPATLDPPANLHILDQGEEGACTGFALAAAINYLLQRKTGPATASAKSTAKAVTKSRPRQVSPHMLYSMARRYDEWPGEDYEGSSLRGALRGFYNCGACTTKLWPDVKGDVSLKNARDARTTTLGAYYRLRPILSDYHAAISETGVIYVSAAVHDGWDNPGKNGQIDMPAQAPDDAGAHAFIIVGYTATGFWIQNSWNTDWGKRGLAHWLYADWARSVIDAWVLQLAVPAPTAFGLGFSRSGGKTALDVSRTRRGNPHRQEIAGHFVHINNGSFANDAPYWSNSADVQATADALVASDSQHFVFYAHGGLNAPDEAAVRTAAMLNGFRRNGIYPYSVFYDTGLVRTLKDVIQNEVDKLLERTGGFGDYWDKLVEKASAPVGQRLWAEMKRDARLPFEAKRDGQIMLEILLDALARRKTAMSIHLIGHSTGSVLIGHLLEALERRNQPVQIDSISLLAPACSLDFYRSVYQPCLGSKTSRNVRIKHLHVYNLDDETEQNDTVMKVYRKSMLYLVSNAYESARELPLLGMEKFARDVDGDTGLKLFNTRDNRHITASESHGGFDNDPATLNHILKTVLGAAPAQPFAAAELDYGGD